MRNVLRNYLLRIVQKGAAAASLTTSVASDATGASGLISNTSEFPSPKASALCRELQIPTPLAALVAA